MDLEPVSHFDTPNHWKIRKRCPKWLPRDSPNHAKITKNLHLDLQVPVGWPLGSLDHQNGVPGTQNGASRSPKWQFYVKKVTHLSSQPVSSCLLTRGRRQGAKPLNVYIHTYELICLQIHSLWCTMYLWSPPNWVGNRTFTICSETDSQDLLIKVSGITAKVSTAGGHKLATWMCTCAKGLGRDGGKRASIIISIDEVWDCRGLHGCRNLSLHGSTLDTGCAGWQMAHTSQTSNYCFSS